MKREYYHFNLSCPNCHEPYISGAPILIENNIAKCSSCNLHFKQYVNFNGLHNITRYLSSANCNLRIPLLWKINPNCVEESYLEWIHDFEPNKYLITWPLKHVKFIPLLVSEYILKNPEKKVVIITGLNDRRRNVDDYPSMDELFKKIIYSKELSRVEFKREILRDINRFDKKNVLIKDFKTFYTVKRIGNENYGRMRVEGYFNGGIRKCRNRLFNQYEEEYGKGSIRNYKRVLTRTSIELINEDGFLDITIGRREEWGGDFNFNKMWLFNILFNPLNFEKLEKKVNIYKVLSEEDMKRIRNDSNILLISDELSPEFIFETLLNLNSDLVIIESFDDFIRDRYWGNKSKALFKFLENTESSVLMFSSIPDIRYLFKLNFEDDITEKYNIKLHTWDSNLIIEKIRLLLRRNYTPNPFTFTLEELPHTGNKPVIEYSHVYELNSIDEILIKLEKFGKKYKLFFNDLKKSPLFLEGDTENDYEVYKRKYGQDSWLNYYKIMISLRKRDKCIFEDINQILINTYNIESTQKNPLMNKILEILNKLIVEKDTFISIVVHGFDVTGTKLLLRENGFEKFIPEKINILKWSKLPSREEELDESVNHVVISTRPPSLDYELYFTYKVDKLIFVGSEGDIKTYNKIIENRLTEKISRPIDFDFKDKNSPELLKTILKELYLENDWKESDEIVEKTFLEECSIKIPSFEFGSPINNKLPHLRHRMIKKGENAVLVIDNTGKGMFLPLNKHVFFKVRGDDVFQEIEIKKSELAKLDKKEILVDRGGVYTSFKHVFTKMMAENNEIKIEGGMFEWENFRDLIRDSAEWIKTLKIVLKIIVKDKKISKNEAEENLSTFLAGLDLNAKDKDHIKKWWSEPEMIKTEYGFVPVYDIEHPKGLNDLIKIYKGLKILYPELKITVEDAEKTYIAAITLQKVRRDFFKNKTDDLGSKQKLIYGLLRKEIKKLIDLSETFKIVNTGNVLINKDVHALETFSESKCAEYVK